MEKHLQKVEFNKKKRIIDVIFLVLIFLIIISFYIALMIRGQKEESITENRALNKIPTFSFASFFSGEYQNKLEDSLVDQMLFSEKIKKSMNQEQAETITGIQRAITKKFHEEKTEQGVTNAEYFPIGNKNVYYYGNSDYMVFKCEDYERSKIVIDKWAKTYNPHFKGLDTYFYLVNTSKSIDFNNIDKDENKFVTYIRSALNFKKVQGLKINSFEQYKDYFYETDHHWNYKGSYQGYRDIIQMIYPEDKLIEPIGTKTYDVYYYGSNARTTSVYNNKEKFTVYKYDIEDCPTKIDGEYARYDNEDLYDRGEYSKEEGYNHYGGYYGEDYAEVIYERNQPEKENLLIIAPSYSNANNKLISTHFNNTYVIDLRHYINTYGKNLDVDEYCKKNHITKVLVMLGLDLINTGIFNLDI